MAKRFIITEHDATELRRIVRKVDGINGAGVINRRESLTIVGTNTTKQARGGSSSPKTYGKPTAALTCAGVYTMRLVTLGTSVSSGGASFALTDLGTVGTTDYTLINLAEIEATGHALTDGAEQPAGGWLLEVTSTGLTDSAQSNRPVYVTYGIGIGCPA